MTEKAIVIKATLDVAPVENGPEFDAWCEAHDFRPLGSGRRAWCSQFQTYFRDAVGVARTEGCESFLVYPGEFEVVGDD